MAYTLAATGNIPQQWGPKFLREYVRGSRFGPYIGKSPRAMIQVNTDLSVKRGNKVTFAARRKLSGSGVTGSATLEGNEEALDTRSMAVTVDVLRHAVAVDDWEEQKSAGSLLAERRPALMDWAMEQLRDDIISAMGSINGVAYASATETQKDAWLVDNADRVMFGDTLDNNDGADHSASLGVIASTEVFDSGQAGIAKRLAQNASPAIRPIKIMGEGGEQEWFIFWVNQYSMRDFRADSVITQALREGWARAISESDAQNHPLFGGGDIVYDGMIFKELHEIPSLGAVGASSAVIRPNYLCGAQAVGVAYAKRTTPIFDSRDYGFINGAGVMEIRGVDKLRFGTGSADTDDTKDHGMLTLYSASAADA